MAHGSCVYAYFFGLKCYPMANMSDLVNLSLGAGYLLSLGVRASHFAGGHFQISVHEGSF